MADGFGSVVPTCQRTAVAGRMVPGKKNHPSIQTLVRWQGAAAHRHRGGVNRRHADQISSAVVDFLAQKRRERGVNYEDLAGLTGLHATSLSLIERHLRNPTFVSLSRIALALGVRLSTLVRKAENECPPLDSP